MIKVSAEELVMLGYIGSDINLAAVSKANGRCEECCMHHNGICKEIDRTHADLQCWDLIWKDPNNIGRQPLSDYLTMKRAHE